MTGLFTDGGLCGDRNPSDIGGTWAFIYVEDDRIVVEDYGFVSPADYQTAVTNNMTELEAAVRGLERYLRDGRNGQPVYLYTDSTTTAARIKRPLRPAMKGVPDALRQRLVAITDAVDVRPLLVAGHPTAADMRAGRVANGTPVSKWNVHCDELCQRAKGLRPRDFVAM
jgi:ribonuclease HI